MGEMRVKSEMQEMMKYNDILVYQQQIKILSELLSNDLSILLYVLYYILFIYDESILCFFIRCFMQLVLSYVMSSSNSTENVFPGLSRLSTLSRLSNTANMLNLGNNNTNENNNNERNHNNESNNITPNLNDEINNRTADSFDEIENMFSRWSKAKKINFVRQLLSCIVLLWLLMFAFQIFFCLGDTFAGKCYTIFGSLKKSIKESAYTDKYISDSNLWSSEKAFTQGSVLLSMIGESKPRSKLLKFFTILLLDCIIIIIQFIEVLVNYIVGFGIVDRISKSEEGEQVETVDINLEDNENIDNSNNNITSNKILNENREYDGRQGRTKILKINPFKVYHFIFSQKYPL